MSDLVVYKLQCIFWIGLTAIVGGLAPLRLRVKEKLLSFGNVFSGGVFLAAGFTHMLQEAVEGFENADVHFGNVPVAYLLCLFGILGTFFIERIIFSHSHGHSHDHRHEDHESVNNNNNSSNKSNGDAYINLYLLALILGVHNLIEGVALGVEDTREDTTTILVAILGHKFFSAFAFGVNLVKSNIPTTKIIRAVILFAIMTPLGILFGLSVVQASTGIISYVMNAISAGTFIYIALLEVIVVEFEYPQSQKDKYIKFVLVIVGVLLMALLNISDDHHHTTHEHTDVDDNFVQVPVV